VYKKNTEGAAPGVFGPTALNEGGNGPKSDRGANRHGMSARNRLRESLPTMLQCASVIRVSVASMGVRPKPFGVALGNARGLRPHPRSCAHIQNALVVAALTRVVVFVCD